MKSMRERINWHISNARSMGMLCGGYKQCREGECDCAETMREALKDQFEQEERDEAAAKVDCFWCGDKGCRCGAEWFPEMLTALEEIDEYRIDDHESPRTNLEAIREIARKALALRPVLSTQDTERKETP